MANLEEWTINTTQKLMTELPGHGYDTARTRVEAWLTAEGGWELDSGESTGGEGSPPNEETPAEAVTAIVAEDLTKISNVTVRPVVTLELAMTESFEAGTTDQEKINAVESALTDRITDALDSVPGVKTVSFSFPSAPQTEREGGVLDETERQAVQTEISAQPTLVDPASIATADVRRTKTLDNTWICDSAFALAGSTKPVFLRVRKYTDTSYATLDTSVTYYFVVSLDRETLSVNSTIKI